MKWRSRHLVPALAVLAACSGLLDAGDGGQLYRLEDIGGHPLPQGFDSQTGDSTTTRRTLEQAELLLKPDSTGIVVVRFTVETSPNDSPRTVSQTTSETDTALALYHATTDTLYWCPGFNGAASGPCWVGYRVGSQLFLGNIFADPAAAKAYHFVPK